MPSGRLQGDHKLEQSMLLLPVAFVLRDKLVQHSVVLRAALAGLLSERMPSNALPAHGAGSQLGRSPAADIY